MTRYRLLAGLTATAIAFSATPASGWIFWTSEGGGNGAYIGRARSDGTHVRMHFIKRAYGAEAIATYGSYIYWTTTGEIGRAKLNGTQRDDSFISRLGLDTEVITVGPDGIYWTGDPLHGAPKIGRANLDGSGVDKHYIDFKRSGYGHFMYPTGIAADSTHLYWTNYFPTWVQSPPDTAYPDTIGRANFDGSDVVYDFLTGLDAPRSLAVSGSRLYWFESERRRIGMATTDGSSFNPDLITAVPRYSTVAADDDQVLWRNDQFISRANPDGTGVDTGFIETSDGAVAIAATQ